MKGNLTGESAHCKEKMHFFYDAPEPVVSTNISGNLFGRLFLKTWTRRENAGSDDARVSHTLFFRVPWVVGRVHVFDGPGPSPEKTVSNLFWKSAWTPFFPISTPGPHWYFMGVLGRSSDRVFQQKTSSILWRSGSGSRCA